ncbi:hypothetical protein E2C01_022345 [Portunus trituberculatus]|uniref:Uncharacterized protein n=1 Tax=Portunus trituberculatus TaxID=210409 RepID=A0A5B7E713_PORTR|nr:hypothetical protein [Portunus trituberculatus]
MAVVVTADTLGSRRSRGAKREKGKDSQTWREWEARSSNGAWKGEFVAGAHVECLECVEARG